MFNLTVVSGALQTHCLDLDDQEMVMALLRDLSSCQTVLYQKDIAALSYLVAMVCGQRTDKEIKEAATTGQCSQQSVVLSLIPSGLFFDNLREAIWPMNDCTF